jgi:hypothetical protein
MLHALIHNKLKDSISSSDIRAFKASEDSLTSSIFGVMQYLPEELLWDLLRRACNLRTGLPINTGKLTEIKFWPKWTAQDEKITNSNYVEPDLFMRFENFDLIVEAKKNDDSNQNAQSIYQWKKEIRSYRSEFGEDKKDKLYFIALGGNETLSNTFVEVDSIRYDIYKASWQSLLNEIVKMRFSFESFPYQIPRKNQIIRLLIDLENAFNSHGHLCIEWFESSEQFNMNIDKKSISIFANWITNQIEFLSEIEVSKSNKSINLESINIFSLWKI